MTTALVLMDYWEQDLKKNTQISEKDEKKLCFTCDQPQKRNENCENQNKKISMKKQNSKAAPYF